MAEEVKLSGVPETMLQTVYARAKESRGRGAICDPKAEEIVGNLNYDFSFADKDFAMQSGVIARTILLDRLVKAWLTENPNAVVVNLACGLDTRCYRVDGYRHWYNLDLPETMAVRQKLLPESGAISQIAMSAMENWGNEILEPDAAVLIIIEGLTMYLGEEAVRKIFEVISKRFQNATVFVEIMTPWWLNDLGWRDKEPRYGLVFCLLPSALLSFLKYESIRCRIRASPNEKRQKHNLCDLPFRKISYISKSQVP